VITQSQRVHRAVVDLLTQLRAQAEGAPPPAAQLSVLRALDTPLNFNYSDNRLDGFAKFIASSWGIDVGIDDGALAPIGLPIQKRVSVSADDLTLRRLLDRILADFGEGKLIYHIKDDKLLITTADNAGVQIPQPVDAAAGGASPHAIRGRIRVNGELAARPPLVPDVGKTPDTRHLTAPIPDESVIVGPEGGLANCLVYLDKLPPGLTPPPLPDEPIRVQVRGLRYQPHTTVVRVGQTIEIVNQDPVAINVHDSPVSNPEINMILPPNGSMERSYQRAERLPVRFRDDVHPWILAWVLPLDHPWAAVTDENGNFEIPQLPPGEYTFKVWHEKAGYIDRQYKLTVTDDGAQELQLTVDHTRLENP